LCRPLLPDYDGNLHFAIRGMVVELWVVEVGGGLWVAAAFGKAALNLRYPN